MGRLASNEERVEPDAPAVPLHYGTPEMCAQPARFMVWALILSLYPVVGVMSLYATVLAGRLVMGHWPRPFLDNPASASPAVAKLDSLTTLFFLGAYVAGPLTPCFVVVGLVRWHESGRRLRWRGVTLGLCPVLVWAAVLLVLGVDPLGAFQWFID